MAYLRNRLGDARQFASELRRNPRCFFQNLLGLLTALLTSGELVQPRDGWRAYHRARGLGPLLPRLFGQGAITVGNLTFTGKELKEDGRLYWHEFAHYEQSVREGLMWLPRYFGESARVRGSHSRNRFEEEAESRGRELLLLYRAGGPVNV
jgi:hypothetical protein